MSEVKILVVEDEAVTGMDIRRSLIDMGYKVCDVAATGEMAVHKAGEQHPDLILMDIMLAGKMNGIEAAEVIKKQYDIPVVYLTAYSNDGFIARAKFTEPFGYILKPFREMELKTTIEMALYKSTMEHALRVSEETTRVLLNATEDYLFLIDMNGRFLAANQALARQVHKDVSEFVGTAVTDLVNVGILSPRMAGWDINGLQKGSVHFEEEFRNAWYDVAVNPVTNHTGDVVLYAVSIRNISNKKAMEEQSRQNEEFFRSLIEETSDVIVILDHEGSIRHESPSLARHLYTGLDPMAGRQFAQFVTEEDRPKFTELLSTILENPGTVRPVRLRVLDKNGCPALLDGIISNLYGNSIIGGIVLNGWIRIPGKER